MRKVIKKSLSQLIKAYRYFLSPFQLVGCRCRYIPTCSEYALDALQQHRLSYGIWLIIKRLARCQPWGGYGYDPVPDNSNRHCFGTEFTLCEYRGRLAMTKIYSDKANTILPNHKARKLWNSKD